MDIAFCKYHASIELLPHVLINKLEHGGNTAYCVLIGFLVWAVDIQWTTKNKTL